MRVGNVVAAVEIVVHVNFPVALQRVDTTIEEFEFPGELKGSNKFGNFTEKSLQRSGLAAQIDVDEILPSVDRNLDEAIFRAIEVADAFEFHHALERAIVAVGPAVIRTAKIFFAALWFCDDRSSVMAADVVESAKYAVVATCDDDRFSCEICGEEVALLGDMVGTAGDLPVCGENGFVFEAS